MDFWSELIKTVVSNGIFAMLFVVLFFQQLKESKKREEAYQETIEELARHLVLIEEVRKDMNDIKEMLVWREDEKL
ncbi:MAG: hypothetical protein J6C53_00535 [Clostridia bacterium]|nr:hypothetical protein [Clostridia bacterium]